MEKNVIILTIGWTGSSVLSGLLSRVPYWIGNETYQNEDYNTYENLELTELNRQLINQSGYTGDYRVEFIPSVIQDIASLKEKIDISPYLDFIKTCEENKPWLWKDPRLWLTIRFWLPLIDLKQVQFIVLKRNDLQSWISCNFRKQILSYSFCKKYNQAINGSLINLLQSLDLPYIVIYYDDLIVTPEPVISKINNFLGTNLNLADLQAIYTKPLYKRPRSTIDFILASMIYFKNKWNYSMEGKIIQEGSND